MGKKEYLLVLLGTKVVEGGPLSIVNSEKTLFSQLYNKGLYLKNLTKTIGFPAPLQHKEPHPLRYFHDKPILSIVTDVRYEATMTAAQNHCHRSSVPVTRSLMQRKAGRRAQDWNLKSRMEFTMNSRNPRLSQNLSMEATRGITELIPGV